MSKLHDDPGFWATEKELEAECKGDEYDSPEEEEDYPLHASNSDPRVINAKRPHGKEGTESDGRKMPEKETEIT